MREIEGVEDDETVVSWAPRDEAIGGGIVNHVISLQNERCDHVVLLHPIKKKEQDNHHSQSQLLPFVFSESFNVSECLNFFSVRDSETLTL